MATINISLERVDDSFHFVGRNAQGLEVHMDDATSRPDGIGKGVGPMQLVLMALGGCSAVDVVSILAKGRQDVQSMKIHVTGQKPDGVHPAPYSDAHVTFEFTGGLDADRAVRAVQLSMDKYCSVAATLAPAVRITASVRVNGDEQPVALKLGGPAA
jgi:putative redox protein